MSITSSNSNFPNTAEGIFGVAIAGHGKTTTKLNACHSVIICSGKTNVLLSEWSYLQSAKD